MLQGCSVIVSSRIEDLRKANTLSKLIGRGAYEEQLEKNAHTERELDPMMDVEIGSDPNYRSTEF